MSELAEKVRRSIERVKAYNPEDFGFSVRGGDNKRYHLAFSGGKDSVVTKRILDMADVEYDAAYRVSSVDPPELVRFIKEKYPEVKRQIPREMVFNFETNKYEETGRPITMWSLIVQKLRPPTRVSRYCCEYLKETAGRGGLTVTGVRWAESSNRRDNQGIVTAIGTPKNISVDENQWGKSKSGIVLRNDNEDTRQVYEVCQIAREALVNPIIDWTDKEVWEFIKCENIPYCGLYDEGFPRLGCIGCCIASKHQREREFARWPEYKNLYLLSFAKMQEARIEKGKEPFRGPGADATDIYRWWMEYDELPGQIDLLEDYDL